MPETIDKTYDVLGRWLATGRSVANTSTRAADQNADRLAYHLLNAATALEALLDDSLAGDPRSQDLLDHIVRRLTLGDR